MTGRRFDRLGNRRSAHLPIGERSTKFSTQADTLREYDRCAIKLSPRFGVWVVPRQIVCEIDLRRL